jgi:hypothetical protein
MLFGVIYFGIDHHNCLLVFVGQMVDFFVLLNCHSSNLLHHASIQNLHQQQL